MGIVSLNGTSLYRAKVMSFFCGMVRWRAS